MIKEALQYLGSLVAATPQPLRLGDKEKATPIVALPDSVRLESVERFDAQPATFRGAFETTSIEAFVKYLELHFDEGQRHPGIFINPEKMTAEAWLDLGTHTDPGWPEHSAGLRLQQTPQYRALLKFATTDERRNPHTQMEFIDFISDWQQHLSFFTVDGVEIGFRDVRRAISALKVNQDRAVTSQVGSLGAARTEMEQVNIEAGTGGLVIPDYFTWAGQAYDELDPVTFRCPIREAVTDSSQRDQKPRLMYRIDGLQARVMEIAEKFVESLQDRLYVTEFDSVHDAIHVGEFKALNARGGRYDR